MLELKSVKARDYQTAFQLLKAAEEIIKQKQDESNRNKNEEVFYLKAMTLNNLGCYYKKAKSPQVALHYLKQAQKLEESLVELDDISKAGTLLNICAILSILERHSESVIQAKKAIRIIERSIGIYLKHNQSFIKEEPEREIENEESIKMSQNKQEKSDSIPFNNYSILEHYYMTLIIAHYNLAVEQEHLQDFNQALLSYQQSLILCEKLNQQPPIQDIIKKSLQELQSKYIDLNQKKEDRSLLRDSKRTKFLQVNNNIMTSSRYQSSSVNQQRQIERLMVYSQNQEGSPPPIQKGETLYQYQAFNANQERNASKQQILNRRRLLRNTFRELDQSEIKQASPDGQASKFQKIQRSTQFYRTRNSNQVEQLNFKEDDVDSYIAISSKSYTTSKFTNRKDPSFQLKSYRYQSVKKNPENMQSFGIYEKKRKTQVSIRNSRDFLINTYQGNLKKFYDRQYLQPHNAGDYHNQTYSGFQQQPQYVNSDASTSEFPASFSNQDPSSILKSHQQLNSSYRNTATTQFRQRAPTTTTNQNQQTTKGYNKFYAGKGSYLQSLNETAYQNNKRIVQTSSEAHRIKHLNNEMLIQERSENKLNLLIQTEEQKIGSGQQDLTKFPSSFQELQQVESVKILQDLTQRPSKKDFSSSKGLSSKNQSSLHNLPEILSNINSQQQLQDSIQKIHHKISNLEDRLVCYQTLVQQQNQEVPQDQSQSQPLSIDKDDFPLREGSIIHSLVIEGGEPQFYSNQLSSNDNADEESLIVKYQKDKSQKEFKEADYDDSKSSSLTFSKRIPQNLQEEAYNSRQQQSLIPTPSASNQVSFALLKK